MIILSISFACFTYMENHRLVEGLCWAQNVLFGAKSVISELYEGNSISKLQIVI